MVKTISQFPLFTLKKVLGFGTGFTFPFRSLIHLTRNYFQGTIGRQNMTYVQTGLRRISLSLHEADLKQLKKKDEPGGVYVE